jgi:hypothetical protein
MQLQTKSDFDFESYLVARRKLVEDRLAIYLVDQEPVRLWQVDEILSAIWWQAAAGDANPGCR